MNASDKCVEGGKTDLSRVQNKEKRKKKCGRGKQRRLLGVQEREAKKLSDHLFPLAKRKERCQKKKYIAISVSNEDKKDVQKNPKNQSKKKKRGFL